MVCCVVPDLSKGAGHETHSYPVTGINPPTTQPYRLYLPSAQFCLFPVHSVAHAPPAAQTAKIATKNLPKNPKFSNPFANNYTTNTPPRASVKHTNKQYILSTFAVFHQKQRYNIPKITAKPQKTSTFCVFLTRIGWILYFLPRHITKKHLPERSLLLSTTIKTIANKTISYHISHNSYYVLAKPILCIVL